MRLAPLGMFGLFAVIFGISLWLLRKQFIRARDALRALGAELNFTVIEPAKSLFGGGLPRLEGTRRGRSWRIFAYHTGSGKSRRDWCALATPVHNPGGLTIRLSAESIFTRAGQALGLHDVSFDDPPFDQRYYVKSNDADFLRAALLPEIRARLLALGKDGFRGSITAEGGELKYVECGRFSNARTCARFRGLFDVLGDLAEVVEARPVEG